MSNDVDAAAARLEVATARAAVARALAGQPAGADEASATRRQAVLQEARNAGLLPSIGGRPPDAAAADDAVWGAALGESASVAILAEVARACAGAGLVVHAAALGARLSRALGGGHAAEGVVAAPVAPRCPPLEVLEAPDAQGGAWVQEALGPAGGPVSFPFVWGAPGAATTVLAFVRAQGRWAVVRARAGDDGVELREDARRRLGLRTCPLLSIRLAGIEQAHLAARGDEARDLLLAHLRRLWLGLAALAAGTADAAVDEAARYANQRVQGGGPIARHAAVSSLLGEAAARAASSRAAVDAACGAPGLAPAAAARLSATADAALAVTSALQVLGGAGYMEDLPLAKRLRDVQALRITHGTPDDLGRIVATAASRRWA